MGDTPSTPGTPSRYPWAMGLPHAAELSAKRSLALLRIERQTPNVNFYGVIYPAPTHIVRRYPKAIHTSGCERLFKHPARSCASGMDLLSLLVKLGGIKPKS